MQLPICIQGPSRPAGVPAAGAENRRVKSESSQSQKATDRRETSILRDWILFWAAHHCYPGSPFTAPVASSWKLEVLYVILLLDFCRFFKSQSHFFFWASSMRASQIFVVATIFISMGDLFTYTLHLGHSIPATLVSSLFWNVPSMLRSQSLCNSFLSA